MSTFLSGFLKIDRKLLDDYGAFDVSIINDLPLFIDPFLLFHSEKEEYRALHDDIIRYLVFLRDKAAAGKASDDLLKLWYCFPEVKQNWFGFSLEGNNGSGLGMKFARALHANLHKLFPSFGKESITEGSHLEKVCLIADGVGRDNISDFTTNLIKDFLCRYTQAFCKLHLGDGVVKSIAVTKAAFNYTTEAWETRHYSLPWVNGDYVLLTPKDMLTRDENWINKHDLVRGFEALPKAIDDGALAASVSNYFYNVLYADKKKKEPSAKDRVEAAIATLLEYPEVVDYYIRLKENTGDEAVDISSGKVAETALRFVEQVAKLQALLAPTGYYTATASTAYEEAHERLAYLKNVIENRGGFRYFYENGKPFAREKDLQIFYILLWFGSPSDLGTEANDGRGPVDFKVSRGARGKTLVEMKLASNTQLEKNLENQVELYKQASSAQHGIKVIIFFTASEERKVRRILKKLKLDADKDIVLIDARNDNKPSASKAKTH